MINVLKQNEIQFRDDWVAVVLLDKQFMKGTGKSVKSLLSHFQILAQDISFWLLLDVEIRSHKGPSLELSLPLHHGIFLKAGSKVVE